jgi:hypothetical protein
LCGFYETIFSSLQDCINTVFLDNRCLTYGTDGDVFYDGNGDGEYTSTTDVYYNENFFNDVWPPLNNVYDQGEVFLDCGVDNLCPGDNGYIEPDFGEGNGTFDSCP